MTVFFEPNGDQAIPTRGAGRNFALLVVNTESPTLGRVRTTSLTSNRWLAARPCASFQPLVDSLRKPTRNSSEGRSRRVSSMYAAASSERQPNGVKNGAYVYVLTLPCKNDCRLLNEPCPY